MVSELWFHCHREVRVEPSSSHHCSQETDQKSEFWDMTQSPRIYLSPYGRNPSDRHVLQNPSKHVIIWRSNMQHLILWRIVISSSMERAFTYWKYKNRRIGSGLWLVMDLVLSSPVVQEDLEIQSALSGAWKRSSGVSDMGRLNRLSVWESQKQTKNCIC